MKKLISKFLRVLSSIIGYGVIMANVVYADIALPEEPASKNDLVLIVLVIVVVLVTAFAFSARKFNKKNDLGEIVEGAKEDLEKDVKEEDNSNAEE